MKPPSPTLRPWLSPREQCDVQYLSEEVKHISLQTKPSIYCSIYPYKESQVVGSDPKNEAANTRCGKNKVSFKESLEIEPLLLQIDGNQFGHLT